MTKKYRRSRQNPAKTATNRPAPGVVKSGLEPAQNRDGQEAQMSTHQTDKAFFNELQNNAELQAAVKQVTTREEVLAVAGHFGFEFSASEALQVLIAAKHFGAEIHHEAMREAMRDALAAMSIREKDLDAIVGGYDEASRAANNAMLQHNPNAQTPADCPACAACLPGGSAKDVMEFGAPGVKGGV